MGFTERAGIGAWLLCLAVLAVMLMRGERSPAESSPAGAVAVVQG
jgi:hypothetical protein